MDEREDRVNGHEPDVADLEEEIETLRDEIDVLVSELDRRRHQAFGAVAAVRNNKLPLIAGGLAAGALLAWWIYSAIDERRDAKRTITKLHKLRLAVARAIADPDRVAAGDPTMPQKVAGKLITTAGTAAIAAFAKMLFDRAPEPNPRSP